MADRLLLVHWESTEADELAGQLRRHGFEVEIECEDGARATRRVRDTAPEAMVIGLDRDPSHGRDTARVVREQRSTRDLPIVFFGGDANVVADLRRVVPDATHVPWPAVATVVTGILRHRTVEPEG